MVKLITVYWRDIPVQVMAKNGRETTKVNLSQRFMTAVDRAAMRARKADADAYLAEWRRVSRNYEGDNPEAEVAAEASRIEQAYSDEQLDLLARAGGLLSDAVINVRSE